MSYLHSFCGVYRVTTECYSCGTPWAHPWSSPLGTADRSRKTVACDLPGCTPELREPVAAFDGLLCDACYEPTLELWGASQPWGAAFPATLEQTKRFFALQHRMWRDEKLAAFLWDNCAPEDAWGGVEDWGQPCFHDPCCTDPSFSCYYADDVFTDSSPADDEVDQTSGRSRLPADFFHWKDETEYQQDKKMQSPL